MLSTMVPHLNTRWLQLVANKSSPLDVGPVTDRCLNGLTVRMLTQNVRGVRFDSHLGLNFSVTLDVLKEYYFFSFKI